MGPSGERCGFCYFCVEPSAVEEGYGWCRRNAPPSVADPDTKKEEPRPPLVSLTAWCGEFRVHPRLVSILLHRNIMDHDQEAV